mmetsp:Transcript_117132/g.327819  ORF Transcript_117132/g.327819 Transcript_117132/m.327819 type:complete len:179 (-) Transcript_117132:676-1212(-)
MSVERPALGARGCRRRRLGRVSARGRHKRTQAPVRHELAPSHAMVNPLCNNPRPARAAVDDADAGRTEARRRICIANAEIVDAAMCHARGRDKCQASRGCLPAQRRSPQRVLQLATAAALCGRRCLHTAQATTPATAGTASARRGASRKPPLLVEEGDEASLCLALRKPSSIRADMKV